MHRSFCFSLIIGTLLTMPALGGELTRTVGFSPEELVFSRVDGYDLVELDGHSLTGEVGKPLLPVIYHHVVLPPTAEITGVEVVLSEAIDVCGTYRIYPTQPPQRLSAEGEVPFAEPDEMVYSSSQPYPNVVSEAGRTGSMGGYRIGTIRLYPLHYVPSERTLRLYTRIELRIAYREGVVSPKLRTESQRRVFGESVRAMVWNPEDVARWSPPLRTWPEVSRLLPPGDYEYVLITPRADSSSFYPLCEWKTKKGVPARIVTREYIYSNYSGANNQERIKNFIRDACDTWGAIWFVLGGDVGWVPYRGCYGYVQSSPPEEDNTIPTGRYWEDLDNNWNNDGDSRYGETNDGPGGGDIDMYADVYVGRISCDSNSEVQRAVDHTLLYEKNPPSAYLPKVVYFSEYLFGSKNGRDICEDLIEPRIPGGWTSTKRYNENGWYLSDDQAVGDMNQGYGLNMVATHGNATTVMAGSGSAKNITVSDLATLLQPGDKRGIHTGICCISGDFSVGTCYAEQLFNDVDSKVAGCIFNSRYGWGTTSGGVYLGSSRLTERLFIKILNDNHYHLGQALAGARDYYVSSARGYSGWQGVYRWCIFEYNLVGDPELPVWTDAPTIMTVDHEDTIATGPSNLSVTVTYGGSPVQGALVCAMKVGEVYENGLTNASGQVTLPISPLTLGTVDVTATAHNHFPYEGVVVVAERRDVGVVSIDAPPDTVDTNSVHTPMATVENYGDYMESFQVACWFDSLGTTIYADTQLVSGLPSGSQTQVSFANWTACGGLGVTYQVTATTLLPADNYPANDSQQKTVITTLNHDVGTISIVSPPDSVFSDSTYIPLAIVQNYGDGPEDFEVACWFDSSGTTVYADTQTVVGLGSGSQVQVFFANWTACSGGLVDYQVWVATLLSGDTDPGNDSQQKTVTTRAWHDVGTTTIQAPPDTVYCDSTYAPEAVVTNFGNMTEDFTVFCTINGYSDTVQIAGLTPGSSHLSQFAPWTVPSSDSTSYLVTVTTLLPGDLDPTNDTQQKTVFALRVGVEELTNWELQAANWELQQNSPNPFTTVTRVQFSVPSGFGDQRVSLCVYDLSGRLLRTMFDELLTTDRLPLTIVVSWDGRDSCGREVAGGLYLYRLKSEEFTEVRKIVLLR